jgi:pilus assembly protein Flp/PilA
MSVETHPVVVTIRHHLAVSNDDRGASLVEYALLVALIAVLCIGSVRFLGASTSDGLSNNTSSMFGP